MTPSSSDQERLVLASLGQGLTLTRLTDQNRAHWLKVGVRGGGSGRWPMTVKEDDPRRSWTVVAAFALALDAGIHVYAYVCDAPVNVEVASWQWASRGPVDGVWTDPAGTSRGAVTSMFAPICFEHMLVWNDHGGRVYLAAFAQEWEPLFDWWERGGRSMMTR